MDSLKLQPSLSHQQRDSLSPRPEDNTLRVPRPLSIAKMGYAYGSNRSMIAFEQGGLKFNYRIAGVVINDARVLLHRGESDGFWTLPGGRGELLEPSQDTLRREMLEELGVEVSVHRLLWVVENFFEYEGRSYHELGFYFSMAFPQDSPLYLKSEPFLGDEEGIKLIYQWFPIDEIERIELYPTFLKQGLKALPEYIQHIVRFD